MYRLKYHIVWCTKYRRKVLKDGADEDLKEILGRIAEENGYAVEHAEVGLDDHVHVLVSAPPKVSVSTIAKQLKGTSSLRLFAARPDLKRAYWRGRGERSLWSPSYFAESVGVASEDAVARYIEGQRAKEEAGDGE